MLKRMIITLSIVSIITMGAAPAQANIWDLLTGVITGASSWAGKATKDLKNLVTAASKNPSSAYAKSYAWAYDTGSKAPKWIADTSGAVWNGIADTATNLGTDLTQCRDNISNPGFNTFVQYQNEIPISLGIGFADTNCKATGSKKKYNIPNKSGGSCVPASRIDGCSFPTGTATFTITSPISGFTVSLPYDSSTAFTVRDKNLMKPTCVQHDICYNSKPAAGYNATTWKAKCDAEFWDNMNTVRQKFKGRFSAELAYAAVVAGGQNAFTVDQTWASTNTCNSAVNDQNTLGLPLFRQAADVDGDGQDEFCRQIGGDIVCSSYDRDTGVFTEKSRIGGDLGYTHSRWLADANGDGKADYCREVGDNAHGFSIGCTSFPTSGSTSTTYHIYGDMGYEGQRWFADVNGDGQDEFCRAVGGNSSNPKDIYCTRYNPSTQKSDFIARLNPGDFGYKGQRWFADVDGNGTDDYCREVGNRGKGSNASSIGCTTIQTNGGNPTFTGYSTYRISGDLGYRDSRWFADVNHDGKADYCRKVGTHYNSSNTKILCDQLQGPKVSQKRLLTIGHSDIGFYHPRLFADFTGDGQMDYLRSVGASTARRLAVLQLNPNHPPVADAGATQTVESTGSVTAVTLNGSASSDPDGNPLTYTWVWTGGSVTGVSPTVNLANGTHNIRLKVDDGKGGTATATTSVTVQDTIAPTVSIAAIPASEATSASGAVVNVVPYVTTADVCGVSLNISPVGTFALGVTTVSVTATDCANNSTSATTTVTVQDTTAPVITPPADITTEATAVQTPVVIGTATATDIFAVSVTSDAPATFPVGTTVVTWTARDANGNTSTATQNVTVVDSTPPSIIAPADLTLEATGNPNTPFVLTIPAVATDAVGVANITSDAIANFPLGFPYGASTVTWTATDAAGNSSTATQTITVVDTTPPSLNVPANVTVEATGALTAASLGSASGTDLFGPITFGNDAPASYAVGATTIHWTATDANGNSTTGTQTVMVTDHTAPVITAPANVSIEANAVNSIVAIGTATASDLVDGVVSVSNNAPATFPLGSTTVTYTSTDAHGNTATATQTVTVADTTPPVLTVPANVSVEANAVSSTVNIGTASATDIFGASVVNDAPATFPLGTTTVTYTATDGNGLTTTGTQTVTVADTTAPVLTVPANVSIEANAVSSTVAIGTATATDIFGASVTNDAPATFPLGTTTVTYIATDGNGLTTTGTQTVTVADTTAPVLTVPANVSVEANAVSSTVAIGTATATDIFGASVVNDAPATFPLGTTTVTYIATDGNGLTTTGTQTVTVADTTAPVLTVPSAVSVEANGDPLSTVAIGTATATDIFTLNVISDAPAAFPLGTTVVNWTATDANGNVSTGTQNVTVTDTTAPVLTVPAAMNVEANAVNSTVSIGTATATDIFAVTVTSNAPATYPLGTTVVTWTATDANGNVTTGTQNVTVVDTTAPAVTAKLVAVGMEEDEAIFRVTFSATDIADPNPTVTASLNGSAVTNGQIVKLKRDDEMKAEFEHGKLEIKGMNFSLNVSATDASGNKGNAADAFAFAPEHHDGDKKHGKKKKDKDHKDG